ncbi:S8 family serine peptidase [Myxococcota bacterium]
MIVSRALLFLAALLTVATASSAADAARNLDPTWDKGNKLEPYLFGLVEERVRHDLQEGAPFVDLDQLASYAKKPASLPEPLNGKGNEALWMMVPVLVARGDVALALSTVELLRNPSANINPKVIHQGNVAYGELKRRQAKNRKAQRRALEAVWGKLSRKRFFESTTFLQTLFEAAKKEKGQPLPRVWHSALDDLQTYPATPHAAVEYLEVLSIYKGVWNNIELYQQVYEQLRQRHEKTAAKRYRFATINMEDHAHEAHPVVIGVFDSGVAPLRYNMYESPREQPNGLDDDGNGLIDDISGLVWDWDPSTRHQHSNLDHVEKLPPELVREFETYLVGAFDRRKGRDSKEARALNKKLASLATVADQKQFRLNITKIGEWAHGTHVAGLATAGNRFAQVASFRFSWTGEARIYYERGPSDQELRWERESIDELIGWINAHRIRVVNASLSFTVEYQEAALAKERGVFAPDKPAYGKRDGKGRLTNELDLGRIRIRAEAIQELRRGLWKKLFDECPNTLFVLAAGNDDHDIAEYREVPNAIPAKHDNVLVVGAVDEEGEWASFTNFNRDLVEVFDFGVNVLSHSPTGRIIPMSGTSMASPNAANTAAKLVSLVPQLGPAQVRLIMIQTADALPAPFFGGIVNEVEALELARKVARAPSRKR